MLAMVSLLLPLRSAVVAQDAARNPLLGKQDASALSAPADPARVRRMQAWLEYLATTRRNIRMLEGVGYAVCGAVYTGLGVAVLSGEEKSSDGRATRNLVSAVAFGVGAGYLYGAVTDLALTTDEARLVRWRAEGTSIDVVTLARFEGELAAESDIARKSVLYSYGSKVGLAAFGGLLLAFTAASDLERADRTLSYVLGGSFVTLGVLGGVLTALSEPDNVRAYRLYNEGREPEESEARKSKVHLTPTLGAREAGLTLSGRF